MWMFWWHCLRECAIELHGLSAPVHASIHINAVNDQTWSWIEYVGLVWTSCHWFSHDANLTSSSIFFWHKSGGVNIFIKISYIDQWDLDYSIYYHNLSGHRQKFEKYGRTLSQFLLSFLIQNIAKIHFFLMIKLFSYTYEYVNMFIRMKVLFFRNICLSWVLGQESCLPFFSLYENLFTLYK